MSVSIKIKKVWSFLLFKTGVLDKKIKQIPDNNYFILMYHRILPKEKIDMRIEPGMYVAPATFECHLRILKDKFNIVSMEDIVREDKSTFFAKKNSKPCCVITFDDGWADFYEYAFPLLKKYELSAIVFLPTSYIGSLKIFWTDWVVSILKLSDKCNMKLSDNSNDLLSAINNIKGDFNKRFVEALRMLKNKPFFEIDKMIEEFVAIMNFKENGIRSFLSWEEIDEMLKSGYISFGAHTVHHAILTNLSKSDIDSELSEAKPKLINMKVCKKDNIIFCYPNGCFDEEIVSSVKAHGYCAAVTTQLGWNDAGSDEFSLKRIGIHEDISDSESLFLYRLLSSYNGNMLW